MLFKVILRQRIQSLKSPHYWLIRLVQMQYLYLHLIKNSQKSIFYIHYSHQTGARDSTDTDVINSMDNRLSYLWSPTLLEEKRIRLKKRTIDLFVWLSELKSFVSLNHTGFSKILKKYDKITNSSS